MPNTIEYKKPKSFSELTYRDWFWYFVNLFFGCWAVHSSWTCYLNKDKSIWLRIFYAIIAFIFSWLYLIFNYFTCSIPTLEQANLAMSVATNKAVKAQIKAERRAAKAAGVETVE